MTSARPKLSVVVPVYEEAENIVPMAEALAQALEGQEYEVLFVDDGSGDDTVARIMALSMPHIRLVQLARNYGQTSALAAGIGEAKGEVIATLDGDLQNDPADIPAMLQRLEKEGADMVVGRRMRRQDGMFLRKIPSRIANRMIRSVSKQSVHDYGCTLKVFRRWIAEEIDLYGELHRFVPILADMRGAKIVEMGVRHHARRAGVSKYGLGRTFRVASDLLLMAFFLRYRQKPMHLFGGLGLASLFAGGLIQSWLLVQKLLGEDIGGRPLFYVGILLLITGVQLITTGFIAELLMRTYYSARGSRPYRIAHTQHVAGAKKQAVSDKGEGQAPHAPPVD